MFNLKICIWRHLAASEPRIGLNFRNAAKKAWRHMNDESSPYGKAARQVFNYAVDYAVDR